MNRNHLALFNAVAEQGGFSKAAETLLLSQPALSLQVAALEKSLGVSLFDRLPRGVRLTKAGEVLLPFAQRIAALEREADTAIRELRGLVRGRLTIGASLTIGSYVLPPILLRFHERHPQIDVDMQVANTEQTQARLLTGELDIGLTEGFEPAEELNAWIFARDELVTIAAPSSPLAGKRKVTIDDLKDQAFVLRELGSGTRAVVERGLRSKGISPKVAMSLGSTEAVKAAVVAGVGLGVVSSLAIVPELAAGTLTVIKPAELQFRRNLYASTLKGKAASPAASAMISLLPRAR